jgi:hypothetical protein
VRRLAYESNAGRGGTLGRFMIGFALYLFLLGGHLEDLRNGGVAYAMLAGLAIPWYRFWGKRSIERETREEKLKTASKHDAFCDAFSCVPRCPQNPLQKAGDARNEEERGALRAAQLSRDQAEIAAQWGGGRRTSSDIAKRAVLLGRIDGFREGTKWRVNARSLADYLAARSDGSSMSTSRRTWAEMLREGPENIQRIRREAKEKAIASGSEVDDND